MSYPPTNAKLASLQFALTNLVPACTFYPPPSNLNLQTLDFIKFGHLSTPNGVILSSHPLTLPPHTPPPNVSDLAPHLPPPPSHLPPRHLERVDSTTPASRWSLCRSNPISEAFNWISADATKTRMAKMMTWMMMFDFTGMRRGARSHRFYGLWRRFVYLPP